MMKVYALSILFSGEKDRYYIGQSSDIFVRLQSHMEGATRSTKHASDWMLMFLQAQANLQGAMALERRIKRTKSRKSIKRYVAEERNLIKQPIAVRDIISGRSAAWQRVSFGS